MISDKIRANLAKPLVFDETYYGIVESNMRNDDYAPTRAQVAISEGRPLVAEELGVVAGGVAANISTLRAR